MRLVVVVLCFILWAFNAHARDISAIVVDTHTGRVIFQHNATKLKHPASLTKMMTLYMMFDALEQGKISLNDKIKFSQRASAQPRSKLGVPAGQSLTVEEAILSLIVVSANDVALAVAEWMGKGSEQKFVAMMNKKAKELRMHDTVFRNAHGLHHPDQLTTARDMAKLSISLKLMFPQHYHYFARSNFKFKGRAIYGHNALVSRYKEVDGLKTGYIKEAGYNLATSVNKGNMNIVSIVMGGESVQTRDALMGFLINAVATRKTGNGLTDTTKKKVQSISGPAQRSTQSNPNFPHHRSRPISKTT